MTEGPLLVKFPPQRRARPVKLVPGISQATRINAMAGASTPDTLNALVGAHRECFRRLSEIFAPDGPGTAEREEEVRLLMSVLQVAQLCGDFLSRRSPHAEVTCRLCAEVCRAASPQIEGASRGPLGEALARCAAVCDRRASRVEPEPAARESA